MNESETPRTTSEQPKRRRSSVERMLVWGGILTLLAVVLIEWTSQRYFAETLNDLEAAMQSHRPSKTSKGLAATEVDQYVHGFVFRQEIKKSATRQRTFRWPSLFKFYKLGVSIDGNDTVIVVDTLLPRAL